jgi:hypothetical protein
MRAWKASLGALVVTVVGCGTPRSDATNAATTKAALEKLGSGMTDAQKGQLARDVLTLNASHVMKAASWAKGSKAATKKMEPPDLMEAVHSMTAAEIQAEAAKARAKTGGRPGRLTSDRKR